MVFMLLEREDLRDRPDPTVRRQRRPAFHKNSERRGISGDAEEAGKAAYWHLSNVSDA
ncbi:hypothetical protein SJ05684_b53170 (plasmid) [Sinorhizobium sojae CCBAU 05684]|uniref:Uncharacterized protein n=1 Tax=Sinorhizobium sojae CCBAU 05684 TaxID=716928 RepID=A0A249PLW6_9HYPH|nr:hypothetical protein SJ05684_b53170 [Sinorhizobium sojae CCBAU 05684]